MGKVQYTVLDCWRVGQNVIKKMPVQNFVGGKLLEIGTNSRNSTHFIDVCL